MMFKCTLKLRWWFKLKFATMGHHTYDTPTYALDSKLENIVKLLKENVYKLFDWFLNNCPKANPDKGYLLVNHLVTAPTKSYLVFVLIGSFILMTM